MLLPDVFAEHPLVRALVDDPANPPTLAYCEGLVGRSHRDGYIRFYLTRMLDDFYDLPITCVRGVASLPRRKRRWFGATAIWVEPAKIADDKIFHGEEAVDEKVLARDWAEITSGISSTQVVAGNGNGNGGGGGPGGSGPYFDPP